ncbi:MAG: hypothetical protein K8I27_10410 [Planctomycetes bacterium]|nr:hypothetical protein [Planctomycetota bacterium]
MSDAVPVSLFLTRRALCPGCGAALQLEPGQSEIACRFCSSVSYVERRLRTIESELRNGLEPSQIEHKTRFIPAHSIGAAASAETACPGCGGTIEISSSQDTTTCPHCGSGAKVERRLVPRTEEDWSAYGDDADLKAFAARDPVVLDPAYPDGYSRLSEEAKTQWSDELDDERVLTLLTATDLDRQFRAAKNFQGWGEMTPRRERLLARVMTLCCDAPPELQYCIASEIINNLLFGNAASDANKRAVFRAAGRSLFRPGLSRPLIRELGLAFDGATLKLMLELAEYQLKHDRLDDAGHALHGAAMAMRDYGMRFEVGEVILYRLLYLEPPILAWVIHQSIHDWQVEDYWQVVQFVDDCAFERPELAPVIHGKLGGPMSPTNFTQYRALLDRIDSLLSPLAQQFALDKYSYHPDRGKADPGVDDLAYILNWLGPRLDDPLFHKVVRRQIERFIGQLERQDLPPIDAFIKQHGEALPPHIRYRYLSVRPDTDLIKSFRPGNLYESDQRDPTPLERELGEWQERFSTLYQEQEEEHEANFRRFAAMRERIKSEDDAAYERERVARRQQQEAQYARNAEKAKEEEAAHRRKQQEIDQQFDDWRKGNERAARRNLEEYRKLHEQTGDAAWLRLIESTEQALKLYDRKHLRRARIAAMPWPRRILYRLMFWK